MLMGMIEKLIDYKVEFAVNKEGKIVIDADELTNLLFESTETIIRFREMEEGWSNKNEQ